MIVIFLEKRSPSELGVNTDQSLSNALKEASPYDTQVSPHSFSVITPNLLFQNAVVNEIFSNHRGRFGMPSPTELHALSDFERLCTGEIEELEVKCTGIRTALSGLARDFFKSQNELKTKRAQLEICRSFRAPIHTLPPEVLSRIFRFILPKSRKTFWTYAPRLLCRVCKSWKMVAESEPSLWNVLKYNVSLPPREENYQNMSASLDQFSVRAAAVPLTIEIFEDRSGLRFDQGFNSKFVDTLSLLFPRCTSLSFAIEYAWFLWHISTLNKSALSTVESLSIRFNKLLDIRTGNTLGRCYNVFAVVPALTKLNLNATPIQTKHIDIPFCQLTELVYSAQPGSMYQDGQSSVQALRWLMKRSVKLRTLDIYLHGNTQDMREETLSESHNSSDEISFDSLESITFRVGFRTSFDYVFRHFHFPALNSLRIVATGRPTRLLPLQINLAAKPMARLPFLSLLTSLSLIRVEIPQDYLLDLLTFTPLLSSLDIMIGEFLSVSSFVVSDQALLGGLIVNLQGPSPIVPRLQDLRLYYASEVDDWPSSLYARLALSRFNWVNNRPEGRDLSTQRRAAGLASYPFRLYLKFETAMWPLHELVADAIGPLHPMIYHPEKSSSFLKEA